MATVSSRDESRRRTYTLAGIAILSAIIVVLTVFCGAVKVGPVQITLSLAPIIVGAAVFGPVVGMMLGAVMGITVFFCDPFVMILMEESPFWAFIICVVKSTFAGYAAGLVYSFFEKKDKSLIGVILAGIVCPVVNTGLFLLIMFLCFDETLAMLANNVGAENVVRFAFFGLVGINFIVELIVNLALSTGIERIVRTVKK